MKKMIVALVMTLTVTANAGFFDFFDYSHFLKAAMVFSEGLNVNLEKLRLKQQQIMDIKEQLDIACDVTETMNPSLLALNELLTAYQVNENFCAPVTKVIKLQSDILTRCHEYYSKPVPENAKYIVGKFVFSIFQSKLILTKCFPIIGQIKFPVLPE
ncbi:MAG: hypothetical protein AABY53_03640 [Bdellovibrionota bacterium]